MSHAIDFDGFVDKLFVLRHLVHGAPSYCVSEDIGTEIDAGDESFDEYWGRLKGLSSNYLIECAVKARMIQEYCSKDDYDDELTKFEQDAVGKLSLGTVREGDFKLTLREASNKIIHSTSAIIEFKNTNTEGSSYKYWDGKYHLHGTHRNKQWHVELCVESWAKAMSAFLEILADNEKTFYMGQDWS